MNWQPIETAPKDGTYFIGGWIGRQNIGLFRWETDQYRKKPRPYWDRVGPWGVLDNRGNPPTHWMPFPEPPK